MFFRLIHALMAYLRSGRVAGNRVSSPAQGEPGHYDKYYFRFKPGPDFLRLSRAKQSLLMRKAAAAQRRLDQVPLSSSREGAGLNCFPAPPLDEVNPVEGMDVARNQSYRERVLPLLTVHAATSGPPTAKDRKRASTAIRAAQAPWPQQPLQPTPPAHLPVGRVASSPTDGNPESAPLRRRLIPPDIFGLRGGASPGSKP